MLAACGNGAPPTDGQVAARVNDGEISVHQVRAVLQSQPRQLAGTPAPAAPARVLDLLIDQELAAQAAREHKLDQDPRVVQGQEAARRELLARAYQDHVAATKATAPSGDEVDRYYDAHPALFARRRLYIVQEATIDAAPPQVPLLREIARKARGPAELTQALRDAGLRHRMRGIAGAAEDIPMPLLEQLAGLGIGESWLHEQDEGVRIYTVVQAVDAPIERRDASGAIAAYLAKERRTEVVVREMRSLRAGATIQVIGSFSEAGRPLGAVAAPSASP